MKQTVVINLYSGPGAGKSTLAAGLYSELKLRGLSVELVQEQVKKWAYEKKIPNQYDQVFLFGNQAREEGVLYHKVDFIITDSPLLLVPFFEELLVKKKIVEPAVLNFMTHAEENGIKYLHFWVPRPAHYDSEGRFQSEKEARDMDQTLRDWLKTRGVEVENLPVNHGERLQMVLEAIGHENTKKFEN